MSRAKLFNMVKSRGTSPNGRNSFDLSNRHAYSMKAGVIKPLKAIHTIPDDFMNVDVSDFSQTFPMHTAAFLRGRKEIAAYFVPYNSIWHNFNQYMATREDPDSALLQQQGITKEPRISLFRLYAVALDNFMVMSFFKYYLWLYTYELVAQEYFNQEEVPVGDNTIPASWFTNERLSYYYDILCSGIMNNTISSNGTDSAYHMYNIASKYGISPTLLYSAGTIDDVLYEGLSDTQFGYFDFDSPLIQKPNQIWFDVVGNLRWQGIVDKLDMLGYGNLFPIFGRFIQIFEDSYGRGNNLFIPSGSDSTTLDVIRVALATYAANMNNYFVSIAAEIRRISLNLIDDIYSEVYVNPYPLFAYNRVFYDMFRNSYYDLDYNVRNYNCDFISDRTNGIIEIEDLPVRFFGLEMHQWKKDMFTGVLPEPQFGVVSSVVLGGSDGSPISVAISDPMYGAGQYFGTSRTEFQYGWQQGTLENNSNGLVVIGGQAVSVRTPHWHNATVSGGSSSAASFDVMALRRAECLQQYRMDLLRAGNKTSDIFKQIFGSNPKSELDEAPYFIEVMGNDIFVDPVVSTAATGNETNGSLGDIAARGLISGNNMKFKFSTKDFGCIIFVAYIVPESMYNSYRIDPHLMNLDPEEHFIPHFQNLGFSPVYGEWLSQGSQEQRLAVRGYAPSYLEFKTDIDLAHGIFTSKYFASTSFDAFDESYLGSLSHWIVARTDMQNSSAQSLANFYINPRILDSVFLAEADDLPDSDQFICYTSIGVQAVRQLSELGLPRFC